MTALAVVSTAWLVAGPVGVLAGGLLRVAYRLVLRPDRPIEIRPILMMLLVELRAGRSVLSALQAVAARFSDVRELQRVANVATVSGIPAAVPVANGDLLVLMTRLSRAQTSGSSAAEAVRRMLESDIARERSRRLARTRSMPVQLMIPMTLLILPGVLLLAYGPTLIALLNQVVVPLG